MDDGKLSLHPAAKLEVLEAFKWYMQRNVAAADSFQLELEKSFKLIQRSPKAWPSYLRGTRKFVLSHFPSTSKAWLLGEKTGIDCKLNSEAISAYGFLTTLGVLRLG